MICNRCKKELVNGDYAVGCTKCGKSYHTRCWVINRGCSTLRCKGTPSDQFVVGETDRNVSNILNNRPNNINYSNNEPHVQATYAPGEREKICPYCQTRIAAGEDMISCQKCHIPHHEACWNENNGCTTYGCTSRIGNVNPNMSQTSNTGTTIDMSDMPPDSNRRTGRDYTRMPRRSRDYRYGHDYDFWGDYWTWRAIFGIIGLVLYLIFGGRGCGYWWY